MRLPRDEECEYAGGPSRTKELEQRVIRLKARVRELESPELTDSGVHLSDPFHAVDTGGLLSMPGSVAHSNSGEYATFIPPPKVLTSVTCRSFQFLSSF